jgi:hypothetical protein
MVRSGCPLVAAPVYLLFITAWSLGPLFEGPAMRAAASRLQLQEMADE